MTAARIGYRWHLRRLMAEKDMYATTQLGPLLAERGITLSREQVYRLVTGTPERLSLATLAVLCDILGCQPGDLIELVRTPAASKPASSRSGQRPRPVRARVAPGPRSTVVASCPAGHQLGGTRRGCPRCRRDAVVELAAAADRSLPREAVAAAVDAAAPTGRAMSCLAAALAADPGALTSGAPPTAGRLAAELIARGSGTLSAACVRCLRPGRQAAVPRRRRRRVPAVQGLAAGCCLRGLRQGQARLRPRRQRPAGLRGVPPRRPGTPPGLRGLRRDRAGRPPRTRRPAGHLRELLPAPGSGLQRMRADTSLHVRRHQPAGLQAVRPAGHRDLRPLRPGPPAGRPLARRTGLRHLLYRRAAPPCPVRFLRADAAAGQPARPGR